MRGLAGKAVLVTGGARGIGAAACRRFVEEGARVIVCDIDGDAARATADATGAAALRLDITDRGAVLRAVDETGPLDVLVNNAGWDRFRPFLDTDPAFWDRVVAVNLTGALNMLHAVLPGMVERGAGRVVSVSSDAGRVGSSGEAVYAACKAGLIALSKTLAREHARDGLTFNVVCPGPTETALLDSFMAEAGNPDKLARAYRRAIPLGRLGRPEDLPGAIAFLASDDAAFVTGQVLSVSGGLSMVD